MRRGGSALFKMDPMLKSTKGVGGSKWQKSKSTLVLFESFFVKKIPKIQKMQLNFQNFEKNIQILENIRRKM